MNNTITNAPSGASGFFSTARFAAYFRLYLSGSRRKLLLAVGQIFIVTFIFMIFCYYTGSKSQYEFMASQKLASGPDPMWSVCNQIMLCFGVIFAAFAGSWMYSTVSSKKTRLTTFEIPASQFEKFLTWWLIYVPVFIAVILVCFFLADALRVLWIMVSSDYGQYAHLMPLKNLVTFTDPAITDSFASVTSSYRVELTSIMIYGIILVVNALFSLGSIYLNKLSFLKTMVILFICMVIQSILTSLGYNFFFSGSTYEITSRFSEKDLSTVIFTCATIVIICSYIYWLGYARYKETEIVNRW